LQPTPLRKFVEQGDINLADIISLCEDLREIAKKK